MLWWLTPLLPANRFEHPAGGYKKIFETCEELSEPLPATVTGLFAYVRETDSRPGLSVYRTSTQSWIWCCHFCVSQVESRLFWRGAYCVWAPGSLKLEMSLSITSLMARPSCTSSTSRMARSHTTESKAFSSLVFTQLSQCADLSEKIDF